MRSMTGYGKGEAAEGGLRVCVEIQSHNRKQIDIALSLPRGFQPLEARIRGMLLAQVSRGRLTVGITLHQSMEALGATAIDIALARTYAAAMLSLRDELNLPGEVTLEAVLRAPGVVGVQSGITDCESAWAPLCSALSSALNQMVAMREMEGTNLAGDLRGRIRLIGAICDGVLLRAPEAQAVYRQQLRSRVEAACGTIPVDEERIAREVVLYADKSDISEELTRLRSHIQQFVALIDSPEPVGRTLEFLTQEIARELNTLAVKSNDAEISRLVVDAKAELERIREQIQNIE